MTRFEFDILRVLNGENVKDIVPGAAVWVACEYLSEVGYARGCYTITQKGRDYLAANPEGPQP